MTYELPKEDRNHISEEIINFFPSEQRKDAKERIFQLTQNFEGQDMNTLGVLYWAAKKGKFDEYVKRLSEYYEKEGKNVPVENRAIARNRDALVLEDIIKKEKEIDDGIRPASDRKYWPKSVQMLAEYTGSVSMELFFLYCLREIADKE